MPALAKKIEEFQPQPDPIQQAMAQAQLELLQAQVAVERAKIEHTMVDTQLKGAKAGTEQAKAGHMKADTDQKNLDFVEQESGVKQERDLQKQSEQAQDQAKLKLFEHGLNESAAENQHQRDKSLPQSK